MSERPMPLAVAASALFQQGKSNVAIGQLLGVHHSTISKIRTGATWK